MTSRTYQRTDGGKWLDGKVVRRARTSPKNNTCCYAPKTFLGKLFKLYCLVCVVNFSPASNPKIRRARAIRLLAIRSCGYGLVFAQLIQVAVGEVADLDPHVTIIASIHERSRVAASG